MPNLFYINGAEKGRVISCHRNKTPQQVIANALDGTPYVQTIGSGTTSVVLEVFARSFAEKNAIDNAAMTGAVCTAVFHDQSYIGYIQQGVNWAETTRDDKVAIGDITLLVDSAL